MGLGSPLRSAWGRQHQQQHRTSQFRLFRVYIVAMAVAALLLLAVAVYRRPGRQQAARKQEGQWAAYSADQVLSLLGMAPAPIPGLEDRPLGGVGYVGSSSIPPEDTRAASLGAIRLNNSIEHPLGVGGVDSNPLCIPFRGAKLRALAIVGNGPIDEKQRREINAFDLVIRFNLMNNWRRFSERADVWVIRFSTEAKLRYWGITNLTPDDAIAVLGLMKGVWLVGGEQADADELVSQVPAAAAAHPILIPQEPFARAYSAEMNVTDGSPSTGFAGLKAALLCTADDMPIHIYGFNWHTATWHGHKMALEKAFVQRLVAAGRVVVHETTCYGQRECGPGDHDQSCHWGTDGKYYCLRGKPRRWTDLTDTLAPGRLQEYLGSRGGAAIN